MISKMLGAFKFSEHAQIKKTRALTQMETIDVESAVLFVVTTSTSLFGLPPSEKRWFASAKGECSRQIRCRSPRVTNVGVPKILIIRKIMCFKIWRFYRMPNLSAC